MAQQTRQIPDTATVREAVGQVARANGALLAVLFGSYARGTQTRHSDVDVIFVEDTSRRFLDRLDKYMAALWDLLHVPPEVFVYTPEEFERMKEGFFVARALAEGTVVYEQGKEQG